MATQDEMRQMASRARLSLSSDELAGVVRLVNETGSLAPETQVVEQFQSGALTSAMLTLFLPRMWRSRLDHSPVPPEVRRAMFEHAEYTEDMVVERRPRRGRMAFRGATAQNREGLA